MADNPTTKMTPLLRVLRVFVSSWLIPGLAFAQDPPKPVPAAAPAQAPAATPAVEAAPASASSAPLAPNQSPAGLGTGQAPSAAAAVAQVSFSKQILPILKSECAGCHRPGKREGGLLMTSYKALLKGGETGAAVTPGNLEESLLAGMIAVEKPGERPMMPPEDAGDPLKPEQAELIRQWIAQGAADDTPEGAVVAFSKENPPVYMAPPVPSALAFSPDGRLLAVSGFHEVLVHYADGSGLVARLIGESPRIQSLAFSPDGKFLAASAGKPTEFGEIQIWDLSTNSLAKSYKSTADTLYGAAWSPDGTRITFGCSDKTVRMISVADGREMLKIDNHSDWVLGTAFTLDGKRFISGGRDRAIKMIDAQSGQFIDDINKLLEPIGCMARHPSQDVVLYGGSLGTPRIYTIADNQKRTAGNLDTNLVRELERQPGPCLAVAWSPDASTVAVGGVGPEVHIYQMSDGKRVATLPGHGGAVFSLAYHPKEPRLVTGSYDGTLRIFDTATSQVVKEFIPVPIYSRTKKESE